MIQFSIKLQQFTTEKNKSEIEIPVDKIISVYECAPFLGSPLSRILLGGKVERSYFLFETLRNIESKIRLGFEEYVKSPECKPAELVSLSMDEFPVFHIVSDLNQHALVLIPLNNISSYENSHKERCIITIEGHRLYINESQLKLTEVRNRIEDDLVRMMKVNHLL